MAWPYIGNQESVSKTNLRDVFKLFGKQFYPVCTSVVLENVFNFLIKNPSNLLKHFFTLCPLQCSLQSHNMALAWVKPRTYTQNSYLHRCNSGEGVDGTLPGVFHNMKNSGYYIWSRLLRSARKCLKSERSLFLRKLQMCFKLRKVKITFAQLHQ